MIVGHEAALRIVLLPGGAPRHDAGIKAEAEPGQMRTVCLRHSCRIRIVSLAVHLLGALAVAELGLPVAVDLVLVVALAGSARRVDRLHGRRCARRSIVAIVLDPVRGDRVVFHSGLNVSAHCRAGARVGECLILAHLESAHGRHPLVLANDTMTREDAWALARWLKNPRPDAPQDGRAGFAS